MRKSVSTRKKKVPSEFDFKCPRKLQCSFVQIRDVIFPQIYFLIFRRILQIIIFFVECQNISILKLIGAKKKKFLTVFTFLRNTMSTDRLKKKSTNFINLCWKVKREFHLSETKIFQFHQSLIQEKKVANFINLSQVKKETSSIG